MLELWRFSVIALNHDVSGRSHFSEIISHSFSILSSVDISKIVIVTHMRINLRTCVVPKNLLGLFLWL